MEGADGTTVCTMAEGDPGEHEADQRLIAASPVLLAALERLAKGVANLRKRKLIDETEDDMWLNAALAESHAAIAQATGE